MLSALVSACGSAGLDSSAAPPAGVPPTRATAQVAHDADDPAIWVSSQDAARSLILGTDKVEQAGALYVFGLDGAVRQTIAPLDRPNNVDVEYDVRLGSDTMDVAVLTERKQRRLRIFAIAADGSGLRDLAPAGLPVLEGATGDAGEPMGIALYRRAADGRVFVVVAPKTGGMTDYLWQYRLDANANGVPQATLVRRFGAFSRMGAAAGEIGEIEAVVADDALGFVYYSDERAGIRKYHADPDRPDAAQELAFFGRDGYQGDREGLAIFATGDRTGYLVSSDQVPGGTRVVLYPREGLPGHPHAHPSLATIPTPSDATDGLDVVATPLPGFPSGLLVMMNSGARNFLLYDWRALAKGGRLSR